METQSSMLAWRIPWTGELGRLQSMGLQSQTRLSNNAKEKCFIGGKRSVFVFC